MTKPEKKKIVSKKHLARVEREELQRRYIIISTVAVFSIVIVLAAFGLVTEGIIKPRKPIANVNGTEITTKDFQSLVRYQRYLMVNEYMSTYQFIQNIGDPNYVSYFQSYLLQIQNDLEPEAIGLNTINQMVDNVLIRDEAEKLGIQVSREEVEKRIQEAIFQYYLDGTPTPAPTSIILPTPTLSGLQMTLVPPTPTAVVTATNEVITDTTEVVTEVEATPTEIAVEGAIEPTPTVIQPTPTIYTEKAFNTNYDDFMSSIKTYARVSEDTIYYFFESTILQERVSELLITDIAPEEEKLWARHILFQDTETGETQANEFLSRVEAGEDFNTVAEELTTTAMAENPDDVKVRYEDLGWFGEGQMVAPFEAAAKELSVGEISQPVQTSFGWHVIQLLGRDIEPRDQASIDQLRQEGFQNWLESKRMESSIDISPEWILSVPTDPAIPEEVKIQAPQ
jgi:peptidyl-prolyl cis-trans isomerase D